MNHIRCPYCGLLSNHMDDISSHLYTVTSDGKPLCPKIGRIDPHKAQELFPQKILGRKYAPKRPPKKEEGMTDGVYCYYSNEGKIIPKSLVHHLMHMEYDRLI